MATRIAFQMTDKLYKEWAQKHAGSGYTHSQMVRYAIAIDCGYPPDIAKEIAVSPTLIIVSNKDNNNDS